MSFKTRTTISGASWRSLRKLRISSALPGPDQRIFDYRDDIDPLRVDGLRTALAPREFDLGGENHRSPNAGILKFANAVLHNHAPLPDTPDITQIRYWPRAFASTVHACVIFTFSELRKLGVQNPSVAVVLSRSNALVSDISVILAETHVYNGRQLPIIEHDVVWDAELSAAAAVVVASILEWPTALAKESVAHTLGFIAQPTTS